MTATPNTLECDVAVIGSGMGGASFAYCLRESGLEVVVVERGDFLEREPANWDAHAVFVERRYHNAEAWIDGHTGQLFSPGVFYYVGGNTKFFGAMLPRFRECDFGEIAHAEGVSPAWPVPYSDFEPWYCEAEHLYRVHGAVGTDPTDPPRTKPYPYPALAHDTALLPLMDSLRRSGLRPFSMPTAVDYGPGRPCILCSTCDGYPCRVDAKRDAEISAIRPALATPNVSLLRQTTIETLETGRDGTRINAAIGTQDGAPIRIEATRFVLACGAVNTAALLLKSATHKHPNGLGNGSGMVGRNYMVHNSTFMMALDPRRQNTVSFQKTVTFNDWYQSSTAAPFPLGNVQMLGKLRAPMLTAMRPWLPTAVGRYITDHSIDLYLTSEDLPDAQNRVDYDRERRAITVYWHANNLSAHRRLVSSTKRVIRAAGYPIILTSRMGIAVNSHQCGTAVMGRDPANSVLNIECRMHEIDNLWIVDSASFPSSAAVNPALTIAANAMRVAHHFLGPGMSADRSVQLR
jgi:choline dehydrogenase-like flavoprotein